MFRFLDALHGAVKTRKLVPLALVALVCLEPRTRADAGQGSRRERVVARIGAGTVVTAGEVEDLIARMPTFQRTSYGSTPETIRRRVLSEVLIDDRLLEIAAARDGIERAPATAYALDRARAMATVRALRARIGGPAAVPPEDVRAYYEANRARFESDERVHVWRILCPTRAEAQLVLDSCTQRGSTPSAFAGLAREHSRDKATYLRGGDLGFIAADGSSSFPELRVDPAIFRAAAGVRNGEIVPTPVVENGAFAVVWRRGALAAVHQTLDEAAGSIRDTLSRTRVKEETERLVATLRSSKLRDLDASPLGMLEIGDAAAR
ncbi:MAG TPA: peptidyl-prolyl cis-trans isomerase [Polyangiaceae bacterium]|nr:peptidyl-prolyl cis-trans isomerase [Polyangiaceae bacterium]